MGWSDGRHLRPHHADTGRSVLKSPEYLRQSAAFVRANQDLRDAAKARDLDAAALDYMALTLTCFQCHKHIKGMRIAVK